MLERQSEEVRAFLLRTSILERMCASLCAVVLGDELPQAASMAQEMLEKLEKSNLFIVPLDNERRWYRYHHLFADLLRQRLQQSLHHSTRTSSNMDEERERCGTTRMRQPMVRRQRS